MRDELIDQLGDVLMNINVYERLLQPNFYSDIEKQVLPKKIAHKTEIHKKCLAYWKRRFNRILNELKY